MKRAKSLVVLSALFYSGMLGDHLYDVGAFPNLVNNLVWYQAHGQPRCFTGSRVRANKVSGFIINTLSKSDEPCWDD